MPLIKTAVTDKNGVPTHRWKRQENDLPPGREVPVLTHKISTPSAIMLGGAPVPEVTHENLYHVGTFSAENKRAVSLEGGGLSVSMNPTIWRSVGGLSGDTYAFDVPDNRFLDYHALSAAQRIAIDDYGVAAGYIAEREFYTVEYWDDDLDDVAVLSFNNQDDAAEEADDIGSEYETHTGYAATADFPDSTVKEGELEYEQILAAVWVSEQAPDLDGVWWQDELSPETYSAPRGVLSMHKIKEWIDCSRIAQPDEIIEYAEGESDGF